MDAAVAVVVHGAVDVLQPSHRRPGSRGDFRGPDKISVRDCGLGELRAAAVHVQTQPSDARVQHPAAEGRRRNSSHTPNRPLFQPRKSRKVAGLPKVFGGTPTVGK